MSEFDVDVLVIGAGLAGSATAWALAKRGVDAHVVESHEVGHKAGSSHGSSRIFRRAYPQAEYVNLTGRAEKLWAELGSEYGEPLLRRTGGIDHGPDRGLEQIEKTFDELDVPSQLLSAAEAEARWPGMHFEGPVLFSPQSGVIDANASVRALLAGAKTRNVNLSEDSPVASIEQQGDAVLVHTGDKTIRARRVVVAAGGWVPNLLPADIASRLPNITVTQQQVFHFVRRQPEVEWPVLIHKGGDEIYALPSGSDGGVAPAFKIGEHERGAITTAAGRDYVVDASSRERMVAYVRRWLPGLVDEVAVEITCLYTTTDDRDFVLDRVGGIVVASPCSGHGAKFTPVLGELLADLALSDEPGSDRFALLPRRSAV